MTRCLSTLSCTLTSAATTFQDFFKARLFFPFFLFVLIVGILGLVGWINNVGSGVFSWLGPYLLLPLVFVLLVQGLLGLPVHVPPALFLELF